MNKMYVCLIMCIFILCGCGMEGLQFFNKSSTEEKVLSADKDFKDVLDKKKDVDERVRYRREEYQNEKRKLQDKIKDIQAQIVMEKKQADMDIKSIKAEIDPYRQKINEQIKDAVAQTKYVRDNIKRHKQAIEALERLNGKSDIKSEKWGEELLNLRKSLSSEEMTLSQLNEKINLLKMKSGLLRR